MYGGTKLGIVLGGVIIAIVIVKTPTKMYKQIQGRTYLCSTNDMNHEIQLRLTKSRNYRFPTCDLMTLLGTCKSA